MEFAKVQETAAQQQASTRIDHYPTTELTDAELAIVGGGVGEVGLN